jgi:hypothetical protein
MQFSTLSGLQRRPGSQRRLLPAGLTVVMSGHETFGARPLRTQLSNARHGPAVWNTREIEMIHVLHPLSGVDTVLIA